MEPETSLPYSQAPATCPYPEPTPSSPHNPFPLPEDPSFSRPTFLYLKVAISLDGISHYRERRLDGRSGKPGSTPSRIKGFFPSRRPDRLSSPPTLLS